MLIQYFSEVLDGRITEEQYGDLKGSGRITIYTSEQEVPEGDASEGDKTAASETPASDTETTKTETVKTGDTANVIMWMVIVMVSGIVIVSGYRCSKAKYN